MSCVIAITRKCGDAPAETVVYPLELIPLETQRMLVTGSGTCLHRRTPAPTENWRRGALLDTLANLGVPVSVCGEARIMYCRRLHVMC